MKLQISVDPCFPHQLNEIA